MRKHFSSRVRNGVLAALAVTAATLVPVAVGSGTAAAQSVPPQSPFLCTTERNGFGQPIVDNQERRGTPVYPTTAAGAPDRTQDPSGWSEQCQAADRVEYRYRATNGSVRTLAPGATSLPADIAMIPATDLVGADQMELGGATEIPYLIRVQLGTLPTNRFLYSMAMLVPFDEYLAGASATGPFDRSHWNGRLLYSFEGGVGIGHSQGDLSRAVIVHEAMRLGHAVIFSSGTRTSTHYNLMLGGRTAEELKARFVADHGDPLYTVGIGGSGGGIQQYVYGQNNPGLIDAAIPQYSYPDMTTQTINVGDCELLEHYMDVLDVDNPRWANWDNRKIIQGQNSIEGFTSTWQARTGDTGSSECIEGWRGATPLALNPNFGLGVGMEDAILAFAGEILGSTPRYPADFPDLGRLIRTHEDPAQNVEWTHWADVVEVYGVGEDGFARVPWDNVGVQYGLRAVADGTISPEEFLDLNAQVGSWKPSAETTPESCGMVEAMAGSAVRTFANLIGMCVGAELDQYSAAQMNFSTDPNVPAPRFSADVEAITAAFESGLVFSGDMPREIPIIDARHYREDELDMHNVHQSFVIRERMRRAAGDADNQLIWFLDARPSIDDGATDALFDDGFRLMDEWMGNILANPDLSVADAKPATAVDTCWDTDGSLIASGDDVWSGAEELVTSGAGAWTGSAPAEVDGVPVGACAAHFPLHSTSRVVAGGPITNDVYKCQTKPVTQAVADGDYGEWDPTADDIARLEAIHPEGVCDYSKLSVGHPDAESQTPPTTAPETTTSTAPTSTSSTAPSTGPSSTAAPSTADPSDDPQGIAGPGRDDYDAHDGYDDLPATGFALYGPLMLGLALLGGGALLTRRGRSARQ